MFKIGNKAIGDGNSTFIIAEAGVNHNGDIKIAKEMVDKAVFAGADAIKFQTFITEKLVTGYAEMAEYQKDNIGKIDSQFNMLKKLELSHESFIEIQEYCIHKEIMFLSTPFDFESADFLASIGVEAFKISSGDLTNIPFLEHIARFNKPIILSSGMATLSEIEETINVINFLGNKEIAVLHCTSNYPAKLESVNLNAMNTIKKSFEIVSGYSDHTEGITVPIAAVAMGANIIEKHFTMDKSMEGPDHKASLNPIELKEMVKAIRDVEIALGTGIKMYNFSEVDTMKAARKSIVAVRYIKAGESIRFSDLDYKRPGNGLSPKFYIDIVGRKTNRDIKIDEQIALNMVE
ncbi:N-acetylneuraminate synthase [Clostridium sp. CM028]|uniref:N-acetylneuraminate synthase n=1 Tax=unclassified Clostridium TaxID=2614128 RepID=UPI001C0B188E|nr:MULTISPECIES: N-acetylneuraminate synthase [unclassified Clostridium]MBU3093638.1 N-acetylneuraminate synthase [Clostridium sp. CF011]MBW9146122.1 N-acetylneuraminate synthase [Clostridium sp. CM027]MBW9148221.1 N-acetylneuraminate synthase [Clostridium sp. CM028]UVE41701.1 N-acetylneuraminate synthase [Clostridium sp. CM027]WAG70703.1 N-acetylneuraminate synthase [Clostridium sp. CF011]